MKLVVLKLEKLLWPAAGAKMEAWLLTEKALLGPGAAGVAKGELTVLGVLAAGNAGLLPKIAFWLLVKGLAGLAKKLALVLVAAALAG